MLSLKLSAMALVVGLSGLAVANPTLDSPGELALHFALARSAPLADSTVHIAPTAVKLWFTETPQAGTTAVRITDAAEEIVPTGKLTVDPKDATSVRVPFIAPVKAGKYTVNWRGMGSDGHVVTGKFSFSVMTMALGS
jgi:methionine-rich copper-binding protein CopC